MEEIERDEDFSSSENRRAEAYEQYELDIAGQENPVDFDTWCEEVENARDDFETKQWALRDTH